MAFLVLLITLGGYKLLGLRFCRTHDSWFYWLRDHIDQSLGQWSRLAMLLTLLIPIAFVGWLLQVTENWFFGLFGIAFQVVILFYAFGRGNLIEQLKNYMEHWRSGDMQSAFLHASDDFRVEDREFDAGDVEAMHRSVRSGLMYQWFEQIFVILFWYLLAGPLAALFIRLVCLYGYDRNEQATAETPHMPLQLQHILEWVPARLLGLTFAVAGNFTLCFKAWSEAVLNWNTPTQKVLHKSGMAALGICDARKTSCSESIEQIEPGVSQAMLANYANEIQAVEDLIIRSLVVWVVFLAILILT